ncbi:hypothetical protein Bhyg_01723 [Pseudolycoriella hygida]|uniref:Uncharacterized protein n=1 Tax=Pseudolycoriella hygida TaxID=35572 RepID=A0A9Q0N9Z0_9DIPT|nr:hypothetical protein Bhyg_01723 [Pseudolycoriella hygida]
MAFSENLDEMDTLMSQIVTEEMTDLDEMDIAMSQIDTTIIDADGVATTSLDLQQVDDNSGMPISILEGYQEAPNKILPKKSADRYLQAYKAFLNWQQSNKIDTFDEKTVVSYFNEASKKYKPNTLWSMYSMLKKTFILKNNVDLSNYKLLVAFLSAQLDGYIPKKSDVFSAKQIQEFMVSAPNIRYLGMKAFGVLGAYRGDELTHLTTSQVKDDGNEIVVKLPDTKTKTQRMYQVDVDSSRYADDFVTASDLIYEEKNVKYYQESKYYAEDCYIGHKLGILGVHWKRSWWEEDLMIILTYVRNADGKRKMEKLRTGEGKSGRAGNSISYGPEGRIDGRSSMGCTRRYVEEEENERYLNGAEKRELRPFE